MRCDGPHKGKGGDRLFRFPRGGQEGNVAEELVGAGVRGSSLREFRTPGTCHVGLSTHTEKGHRHTQERCQAAPQRSERQMPP